MRAEGESYNEIAEELGRSKADIYRVCMALGCAPDQAAPLLVSVVLHVPTPARANSRAGIETDVSRQRACRNGPGIGCGWFRRLLQEWRCRLPQKRLREGMS